MKTTKTLLTTLTTLALSLFLTLPAFAATYSYDALGRLTEVA